LRTEEQLAPNVESQKPPILPIDLDDAALDALFASCIPRLQRSARQLLRNPQDCEDVMQDGLLLAFRKLHQFEGRSSFSTWLHSILRNSAKTHIRRMKCRPQCLPEEELSNEEGSPFDERFMDLRPSPEEECADREKSRLLREVLPQLPPRYGLAMQLCDVEGLGSKAATEILGISSTALKTCLFRARRLATRRIRSRFCRTDDPSPNHKNSNSQRNRGFSSISAEAAAGGAMPAKKQRYSMYAGA
jgi:RNA polymerase sigma-70 factor, ECF subfamily